MASTRLLLASLSVLPARVWRLPPWCQFMARSPQPARGGAKGCHPTPFGARLPRASTCAALVSWWWCKEVGVDSGWEALHEVTIAGCPKLEAPEPDHVPSWERI